MNTFKHSGALGDLIYGLAIANHVGGGEFYLHLNQLDWVGSHYYGNIPSGFHKGRMTQEDFEYMRPFMEALPYITKFAVLDNTVAITHNLDRFRPDFVGHPTNYLELYGRVFGLDDQARAQLISQPWLSVPKAELPEGRSIVVNRTARWTRGQPEPEWAMLKEQGVEDTAVFVGLPEEYEQFKRTTGWILPHHHTQNMLEVAQAIQAADVFVGNQSQCYALAVGLGVPEIYLETRKDLPLERNECYFPGREGITYF